MPSPRTFRLPADLGRYSAWTAAVIIPPSRMTQPVMQHVEPGTPVEIDDVSQLKITLAPARMASQRRHETEHSPRRPRPVVAQARQAALDALAELAPAQRTDHGMVEEALRRAVRSAWKKGVEKRPMVLPVVLEM